MPEFKHFSGTVIEINPSLTDGEFFVLVEGEANEEGYIPHTNFFVTGNSLLLFNADIEVGMAVKGFYDTGLPVPMIYPPQYQARVLVSGSDSVHVDRFDANFNAFTGPLRLEIGEETAIIFEDGSSFEGNLSALEDRALVVLYDMPGTPADGTILTVSPTKIIILFERAVHPTLMLTQEDLDIMWDNMLNPETVQVIIDGEAVEMPTPFVNREAGFVMVPVTYIAEALGYDTYALNDNELMIGRSMITVGMDSYAYNRMAAIELGAAPELHDEVLFVPLHFFGHVFPVGSYMMDGNVIIHSYNPDFWLHQGTDAEVGIWDVNAGSAVQAIWDDWTLYTIIIDGHTGISVNLYTAEGSEFPTHVPLLPAAEALGVLETVVIDDTDPQIVSLEGRNGTVSFAVGSENFNVDGDTLTLFNFQTSVEFGGEIYVPIAFFSHIFGMGSSFWQCGQVHIDTYAADDMS
jgi:hypothetical protein